MALTWSEVLTERLAVAILKKLKPDTILSKEIQQKIVDEAMKDQAWPNPADR
jgi:hypothetical protein